MPRKFSCVSKIALLAVAPVMGGCMDLHERLERLAQISSGYVGCPAEAILVETRPAGTWTATCQGRTYYCSVVSVGKGGQVSCAPAETPVSSSETAASPSAPRNNAGDPPGGAAGFVFLESSEATAKRCTGAGKEWSSPAGDQNACSSAVADVGLPAPVDLQFRKDKLCDVSVAYVPAGPEATKIMKRFVTLRKQLGQRYGNPAVNDATFPGDCLDDAKIPDCVVDGRASARYEWHWNGGQEIKLQLKAQDAKAMVELRYHRPECVPIAPVVPGVPGL
jgi:hypothetical protein